MELKYWAIRLIELLVALTMLSLSLYSLVNNYVYYFFSHLLMVILSLPIPVQILPLIPLIIVSALFLLFYALGKHKYIDAMYVLSWLMHLPTVLHFSQIDWPRIIGLSMGFQNIQTKIGFMEALLISLLLVAGRILLHYTLLIRNIHKELLFRGAGEADLEKVLFSALTIASLCISLSLFMAFGISLLAPALKDLLAQALITLPYPYVLISVICLIAIPMCAIIYIYSRAK